MENKYIPAVLWVLTTVIVCCFLDHCPKSVYLLAVLTLEIYILTGG